MYIQEIVLEKSKLRNLCPFAAGVVKPLTHVVQRIRSGNCEFTCAAHTVGVSPNQDGVGAKFSFS